MVEVECEDIEGIMLLNTYSFGNPILFAQFELGLSIIPFSKVKVQELEDLEMNPKPAYEKGFTKLADKLSKDNIAFVFNYDKKIFNIEVKVVG